MRAYLLISGTIFTLFAVSHIFITYEHWRGPNPNLWSVLVPAFIAVCGAVLAIWAWCIREYFKRVERPS